VRNNEHRRALITGGAFQTMQLNRTMRIAEISATGMALALLPAAGVASAHEDSTGGQGVQGRVASVGAGEFVLQSAPGHTQTVDTTPSTAYSELGNSTALPGVLDGEWIAVNLDPSNTSPTATSVTVFPDSAGGKVTDVSGSTITLVSPWGGSRSLVVSPSTTYSERNATPSALSDGEVVFGSGLPDPTTPGAIDAQSITIMSPSTSAYFTALPSGERPCPPQPQSAPTAQAPVATAYSAPSGLVSHQAQPAQPATGPSPVPAPKGPSPTADPHSGGFGSAPSGHEFPGHGIGGSGSPASPGAGHQGGPGAGFGR
jgi:hypothetical protein